MGLSINKVLANVQQSLDSSEKATARSNIGAVGLNDWGLIVSGIHTITAEEASDNVADISGTLSTKTRGLLFVCFGLVIGTTSPQAPTLDEVPIGVVPLLDVDGIQRMFACSTCSGHLSNLGSGSGDGPWSFSGTCLIDTTLLQDPIASLILKLRFSWKTGAIPSGTELQNQVRVFEIGACTP